VGLSILAMAIMAGWGVQRFGSIAAAMAYIRGDELFAVERVASFGTLAPGESRRLAFRLINTSHRSIRVVGARPSCSCMTVEGIPLVIPPSERANLTVLVRSNGRAGSIDGSMILITNSPRTPLIELGITGIMISDGGEETEEVATSP
jgi:hypothetical protein